MLKYDLRQRRGAHDLIAKTGLLHGTTWLAVTLVMSLLAPGTSLSADRRNDVNKDDLDRIRQVTEPTSDFSKAERYEAMSGGAATSRKLANRNAFSNPSANLSFQEEQDFKLGNALFRKLWVSSPSSTQASDGLGPLFNARACQSCHLKDGRGHPPEGDTDATSMFFRLARPAQTAEEERALSDLAVMSFPDPIYGGQLQDLAVPGLAGEGKMAITYDERPFIYEDGTEASLRKPAYAVSDLAYGPLDPTTILSPRIAPPMIGMGLIEAIHPADIVNQADPDDASRDGISGRPAFVRNPSTGEFELGRFGWKAENATVRAQSAGAFSGDIGISSPDRLDPFGDCTISQTECRAMPTGVQARLGETEAPDPVLDLVTFYSKNLAVPPRRNVEDPNILKGKAIFYDIGCPSCHTPKYVTSRDAENPAHAFQLIWPYSDFLLHDMGEGLADGQAVGRANGQEWRTPPLWGIGLTETVSDHTFFLHDGRARNLEEAILWHDGEGEMSRDRFAALDEEERSALLDFLGSL